MKKNSVNILANVIAPSVVVMVTVALFLAFMPAEPGTLFWFNMAYTALLEIMLFAYIGWLPSGESSVVIKWMCGTFSIIYIFIGVVWMLLYGLGLCHWCPLKVYFAVIAVITALWIFAGASAVKVDHISETSKATLSNYRHELDKITGNATMLLEQFNLLKARYPEMAPVAPSVTALCRGLITLSPTAMADESAARRVKNIVSGLEDILGNPFSEELPTQLKDYADTSIIILNNIKKSIRK